jgi:leucyl-tRNA synthetase
MVISPEHPLLKKWQDRIENWDEVVAYQEAASRKSDFERGELNKEKTGVQLKGIEVLNPVTGALWHNCGSVFVVVNAALLLRLKDTDSAN